MALILADRPDPENPGTPIPAAYAWIEHIQLGMSDGSGRLVVWVQRSADAAARTPIPEPTETVEFSPGDGTLPTLADMLADPDFSAAFAAITAKLYGWIAPKFPGATQG